jgi:hypothetical protein
MDHLKSIPGSSEDEESAIDYAALLIWGDKPRIITGADVLGKLLKGITAVNPPDCQVRVLLEVGAQRVQHFAKALQHRMLL